MYLKLKESRTSFEDLETGFKVEPGATVKLDPNERKGKLTLRMIKAGGLIEVNRQSKADDESDLPEDFPTRSALIAAGFDSLAKVRAASDEELIAVKGVTAKTVPHIREAAK